MALIWLLFLQKKKILKLEVKKKFIIYFFYEASEFYWRIVHRDPISLSGLVIGFFPISLFEHWNTREYYIFPEFQLKQKCDTFLRLLL